MRQLIAFLLIGLGVLALGIQAVKLFSGDNSADAGANNLDIYRPHTLLINPIVGLIALVVGVLLLATGGKGDGTNA